MVSAINLRGLFLCAREVLKQGMPARNEGMLIFISSGCGMRLAIASRSFAFGDVGSQ